MKEPDPPIFFGDWLKRRRKVLDLTQAELAQCAGCSVFAVRKVESGERRPSKQLAALLADCLEIPPEEQSTFVRVARGELYVDRLRSPFEGRPASPRPARKRASPPSGLPLLPTALVGRKPELDALSRLLRDPQCRLLTLLGPGGIGKTRLAIESSAQHQEHFGDGTFFVSLASLSSPAFLVPAIADALEFAFQGQVEPRIQLLNRLKEKEALLVLDNAEHLLDGAGLFAEILENAPKVKLLVTSRERLNLQGEWVFEVQGLPVPPSEQAERAEEYSAVALFVQSALRAKAGFALGAEDRKAVVHICQIVEGMPLGIELAAAWVSVLSCQEIEREIGRGLDFLSTSKRDVPERQRSLRAAFDHSWNLLSDDERRALRKLAIFQGGFERRAAEQIAGATLASLMALASKSLVRYQKAGRYDLHELVRQFAMSHLADDPQCEATCDRHCDFYLAFLREREDALKGSAQREAIRELIGEIDNIRAAWVWAVEREKFSSLEGALRSYALLCDLGGWLQQGVEQLDLVVQALRPLSGDEAKQRVLGQALMQQGDLLFRQGNFEEAIACFEESLSVLRPIGDPELLAGSLIFNGVILHLVGELKRAESLTEEGLVNAQAAGDKWFIAYGTFNLGYIAALFGRHARGYEQMQAGLAIWRALGDLRYIALGLNFIAPTAIRLGLYEEADGYLKESLSLCTQLGDRWGMGTAYRYMGLSALAQGDIPKAKSLLNKSLEIFHGVFTGWDIVKSLIYLAEAEAMADDLSSARQNLLEALRLGLKAKVMPLVMDAIIVIAALDARGGQAEGALEMAIFAANHPASTQDAKDRAELLAAWAEKELPSRQVRAIREGSKSQSLEGIVSDILNGEFGLADR